MSYLDNPDHSWTLDPTTNNNSDVDAEHILADLYQRDPSPRASR